MNKLLISSIALMLCLAANAQKQVYLTLTPKVNNQLLKLHSNLTSLNGLVFNVDHFNYYLSDLHIIHDGGQNLDFSDTIFLVKSSDYILNLGILNLTTIERIDFAIGVPPNLNTSAGANAIDITTYPANHPLSFQDPSMYWGWSAGYMHMIVGGKADANNDGMPETTFELHNLGDLNYLTYTLPVIPTQSTATQLDVYVNCHLDKWLKNIPLQTVGILHGTTGWNHEVMRNVALENVFDQSATASVPALYETQGKSYFTTDQSTTTVVWSNVNDVASYRLIDQTGRQMYATKIDQANGTIHFDMLPKGTYIFQLLDHNQRELNTLNIIK